MKLNSFLLFILISSYSFSGQPPVEKLKKGRWLAHLYLNDSIDLPFFLEVGDESGYTVINGKERISLTLKASPDTCELVFPYFNSKLVFTVRGKKSMVGFWINYNKGNNYKIPFEARFYKDPTRFPVEKDNALENFNGKWKTTFEPGTADEYFGIGLFEQEENSSIQGTFMTETGDYRFLEGNVSLNNLYLSCFDGSHAFLFNGKLTDGEIKGNFYSGNHWWSEWKAQRDDNFELTDPEVLTFIKDTNQLQLDFRTLTGEDFHYPNSSFDNKVVIIQIMGTWCPNCLDESQYFKQLHNKYHDQGLEIIAVGYETGNGFEDYARNIERLKNKLNVDFTFLVGGPAKKAVASDHFKMLNEVISFPTSIFIGKDGAVKRVHTGFNGPGTGSYYEEYTAKTEELIQQLLNQ